MYPVRWLQTAAPCREHFFRYTSGRWIHAEQKQLALRYQRFSVDALKRAVLNCTGAARVEDFQKVAEGRCNKVFRVQLDNGRNVVAERKER